MRMLRKWRRRMQARRRLRGELGIWYRPEYTVDALGGTARASVLDVRRSERIAGAMVAEGLARTGDLRRPDPVSMQELLRVHAPAWLESVGDPRVVGHVLGLEPSHVPLDEVLSAQRYATGGTIAAARAAARGDVKIGFNLGGGFHHAEPEQGSGFCLYNDVAVAVANLRAEGFGGRVAIVDLDYHQGNGSVVTFSEDPSVLTWSIHGSVWTHVEALSDRGYVLPPGTRDAEYLELLHRELEPALQELRPELVVYVAGNDVLAGDRLGDFALTPAGVFERDSHVTRVARKLGAKLVVTMAGGYSDRAWRCTTAYLLWLLTGEPHTYEVVQGDLSERYEAIARSFASGELQREGEELSLSVEDVMGELFGPPTQRRILGFYSLHGLELALERYGFFDVLRGLGFEDFSLYVDPSDPSREVIRLEGRRRGSLAPRALLIELVLRLRERSLPAAADPPGEEGRAKETSLRLLSVEWLLLQDPTRPFSLERPPLPGQDYPGLGCAREVLELLAQVCKRLELDGAINRPGHYHVALFAAERMQFLDPVAEGRFAAMRRILRDWDPAEATAAVAARRLRLGEGRPLRWIPEDFVLPISERLRAWLSSERYREIRDRERDRLLDAGLFVETHAGLGGSFPASS